MMRSISKWLEDKAAERLLAKTKKGIRFIKQGGRSNGAIYDTTNNLGGRRVAINVTPTDRTVQVVCYETDTLLLFIKEKIEAAGYEVDSPDRVIGGPIPSWAIRIQVP